MDCLSNREAELATLGLCMQDQSCAVRVAALTVDYFSTADTQAVHKAVSQCVREGRTPDMITLADAVKADIAAPEQLLFACLQAGFAPSMCGQYLGILAECRQRRMMRACAQTLLTAAADPSAPPDMALSAVSDTLRGDAQQAASVTAQEAVMALYDSIEGAKKGRCYTGIADLDRLTGGFRGGKLIILGARPGVGKTALALQMAEHVATHCAPVLIVSLEMDSVEVMGRIAARRCGVDVQRMETGDMEPEDWAALDRAVPELSQLPVRIAERADTPALIRREAAAMLYGGGLGMIVVDYLQLLHGDGRYASRTEEVGAISRELKRMAMDLGVPVLAMTQFNRLSEGGVGGKAERRKPQMSESKDSGSIEQDANMFLTLWQPPDPSSENEAAFRAWRYCEGAGVSWMALHVDKNRQGRTGCMFLGFDKPHMHFACLDTRA